MCARRQAACETAPLTAASKGNRALRGISEARSQSGQADPAATKLQRDADLCTIRIFRAIPMHSLTIAPYAAIEQLYRCFHDENLSRNAEAL